MFIMYSIVNTNNIFKNKKMRIKILTFTKVDLRVAGTYTTQTVLCTQAHTDIHAHTATRYDATWRSKQ